MEKFGADTTRLEDANFDEKLANANVLRVYAYAFELV